MFKNPFLFIEAVESYLKRFLYKVSSKIIFILSSPIGNAAGKITQIQNNDIHLTFKQTLILKWLVSFFFKGYVLILLDILEISNIKRQ